MSLFFSHFSPRKPICNEKITAVDHAIDYVATASGAASTVSPLLNHNQPYLLELQSYDMIVLSRRNTAPSFEDTLHSGTFIPGVSPGGGEGFDSLPPWRHILACKRTYIILYLIVFYFSTIFLSE